MFYENIFIFQCSDAFQRFVRISRRTQGQRLYYRMLIKDKTGKVTSVCVVACLSNGRGLTLRVAFILK